MTGQKPHYGNWVSTRLVYGPSLIGLIFLLAALRFRILIIPAILLFMVSLYFAYARYLFSSKGLGN